MLNAVMFSFSKRMFLRVFSIAHEQGKFKGSFLLSELFRHTGQIANGMQQGCALAEPSGPWRLTFALGRLENLIFFTQIICWAP